MAKCWCNYPLKMALLKGINFFWMKLILFMQIFTLKSKAGRFYTLNNRFTFATSFETA